MSVADPIELHARGLKVSGWTSVRLDSSLEQAASTLSVTRSGYYAATGDRQLLIGDLARLFVGDDLAWSGFVETVDDQVDAETESTTFTGRSKACDAVDGCAVVGSWSGLTLLDLLGKIIGQHGVTFVDEVAVGATIIGRFRTEVGETIHDVLDRLSRDVGILITDDPLGRVVLTRAGRGGKVSSPIVCGAGVLSSSGGWSLAERFRSYEVQGQSIEDADIDVAATGIAADPGVTRHRKLIINPERGTSKAQALKRARWEAVTRAGKSFSATYRLRGWRHREDSGPLWRPNQLVEVVDGRRGLFGVELLVTAVGLVLDDNGRKAEVTVQPAAGFDVYVTGEDLAEKTGVGRWFTTEAARTLGEQAVRQ